MQRLTTTTGELTPTHAVPAWNLRLTLARHTRAIIAAAFLVSTLAVALATWQGVGLSPDSLQYLSASESLASGAGLETVAWDGTPTPMTHYPPGYPLLLAAMARLGITVESAARTSNFVLFAVTLLIIGAIGARITPRPSWTAALTVFACAVSRDLLVVHSMAWSEPLYLTLTTGGILMLAIALQRRSPAFLAYAGALAAAAALTRYVGLANIALVALGVLLWWRAPIRKRLGIATLAGALMLAPLLITILAGGNAQDGAVANRHLVWHPIALSDARMAASVIVKWVTPLDDATYVTAVWLGLFVFAVMLVVSSRARQAPVGTTTDVGRYLKPLLALFAALYLALLVTSMSLVDAQTLFEPRLLAPLQIVAFCLGIAWLARHARRPGLVRQAVFGSLALVLIANVARWWPWLREAQAYGLGLRRSEPDAAMVVESVQQLPLTARIYSNDPYYLRVQAQRPVAGVPRTRDPNSLLPNEAHATQVQGICESANQHATFLVLFDTPVSGDSTARAPRALQNGAAERLTGGTVVRVAPGCTS